jgi:hypothetical protein
MAGIGAPRSGSSNNAFSRVFGQKTSSGNPGDVHDAFAANLGPAKAEEVATTPAPSMASVIFGGGSSQDPPYSAEPGGGVEVKASAEKPAAFSPLTPTSGASWFESSFVQLGCLLAFVAMVFYWKRAKQAKPSAANAVPMQPVKAGRRRKWDKEEDNVVSSQRGNYDDEEDDNFF